MKEEEEKKNAENAEPIERTGTPSHKSEKDKMELTDRSKIADVTKSLIEGGFSSNLASVMPEREKIDNDFKPVIMQLWKELGANYKMQMNKIFKNSRLHRE